jgi:hypothetical protein
MKLNDFFDKHKTKLNSLSKSFVSEVYFKDFGEKGLEFIEPEVEYNRDDGSGRKWRIDFVVKTTFQKYAIELDGYNYHAPGAVSRERFDDLHLKNNFINNKFEKYIQLTRDQVMQRPDDAIFELRRIFKADEKLFNI